MHLCNPNTDVTQTQLHNTNRVNASIFDRDCGRDDKNSKQQNMTFDQKHLAQRGRLLQMHGETLAEMDRKECTRHKQEDKHMDSCTDRERSGITP